MSRGVRGTFETRRATLAVKSQGRLLPVSLEIAIAVSSRATLAVKSEGRVAKVPRTPRDYKFTDAK